jgi:hypothetical protein
MPKTQHTILPGGRTIMRFKNLISIFAMASLALLATSATGTSQQYEPTIGQQGKDVIWVPTGEELVNKMLDMAKLTSSDFLIDLGSGDGRIVIAAAKRGARARGVEYNPDMVELSRQNAAKAGVSAGAEFVNADIFETDFSNATVLTLYLLPTLNLQLRPKILEMKPGTRVVSHSFDMGDWKPDQTEETGNGTAHLWIVPAKVAGTWEWTAPSGSAELILRQTYQKIEGTLKAGAKELPLHDAVLNGDAISFAISDSNPGQSRYAGRVSDNLIEGTVKVSQRNEAKWTARRRPAK